MFIIISSIVEFIKHDFLLPYFLCLGLEGQEPMGGLEFLDLYYNSALLFCILCQYNWLGFNC